MTYRTVFAVISIFLLILVSAFGVDMPHEKVDPDCELCHTTKSFKDVSFDHNQTGFSLDGGHSRIDCLNCHSVKDFSREEEGSCLSCHSDVHEAKLGPDCSNCHSARGWSAFDPIDIHSQTTFPLMGKHALVDCQSCHQGLPRGDLSFNTTSCIDCHQDLYLGVGNPNHVAAGFSTNCEDCHQMNFWKPSLLTEHDLFFPIYSGEHRGEWNDCATCHTDPNSFQVFSCLSCHEHRQLAMDDSHSGISGYAYNSEDCYLCHPTGTSGNFVAHDAQYFPIFSGTHREQWDNCRTCHTVPFDRTAFECLSCHKHNQTDMDASHGSMAGYNYNSQDCYFCHPTGLRGQFVSHDAEFFPIFSGMHSGQWANCTDCHTNPSNRSDFNCLDCHTEPEIGPLHNPLVGYSYNSQDCLLCHPRGEKEPYLAHDQISFPIFSGIHIGLWDNNCRTCHPDPANRQALNCFACHKHNQTDSDASHAGIAGYNYNSQDCYFCHPSGTRGQFLAHDQQNFPIFSGTHAGAWGECTDCHTVPQDRKVFTCLPCHVSTDMNPKHGSIPGYAYSSPACYDCHPDGMKGLFTDHDPIFPIFSGPHQGKWNTCSTCHTDPNNRAVFTCFNCHKHNKTKMDDVHSGEGGYVYDSDNCYSCHPNGKA